MTLKIEWDGRNEEFWVRVGTPQAKRRVVAKTSKEMIRKLESFGLKNNSWKFSFSAKRQIRKEK